MVLTLFLAVSVSAYVPVDPMIIDPTLTPVISPGIFVLPCNCNDGYDTTESCTIGSCEGTRECQSSSTCLEQDSEDCENMMCGLAYSGCTFDCSSNYDLCIVPCSLPWASSDCESDCQDTRDSCLSDCDDANDECNSCDGKWSSCEVDLCCGVNCEDNELCDGGTCECADTEERCAADGTGDGVDNDCDGDVDEDCLACSPPATRTCTDINNCTGIQNCEEPGDWTSCEKFNACCGVSCGTNKICNPSDGSCECKASSEHCGPDGTGDGIDNDCDGDVDEDCSEVPVPPEETPEDTDGDATDPEDSETGEDTTTDDSSSGTLPEKPPSSSGPTLPPKPPKTSSSELDLNLIIILLIVIIAGIFVLLSIKMMKGKKAAQPAPQPAQPAQPAQPPQ